MARRFTENRRAGQRPAIFQKMLDIRMRTV